MREDRYDMRRGEIRLDLKLVTEWEDGSDVHHNKTNQASFPNTKLITLYYNLNNHSAALDLVTWSIIVSEKCRPLMISVRKRKYRAY